METVSKERWQQAIRAEDHGWDFHDKNMYSRHEAGNQHGQIVTFARCVNLFEDFGTATSEENKFNYNEPIFDLGGKTIVDIAGGPSSLLLRCKNFKKAYIVDPGDFPDYITNRYKEKGIEVIKVPAEEFSYPENVDEVWMYNALAHVYDPFKILLEAKAHCKTMRVIEGINCGTDIQHPQNLTAEDFEKTLNVKGTVVDPQDPEPSPRGLHFVGVFRF